MKCNTTNLVESKEYILEDLLVKRGVVDPQGYIYPTTMNLNDPATLSNIDTAAKVLSKHLSNNSKIGLIVDCDQDGFTSAAMMYLYIKDISPIQKIEYFIHDGKQHGLEDLIDDVIGEFDLLIVPDAGSNDFEYHKQLRESNTEILILDHHESDGVSKDAIVINNQYDDYQNKDLSGAGVVYKFLQYYDKQNSLNFADNYLDLAAVGIVGDMMDLRNYENRYICDKGFKNIHNPFIRALLDMQRISYISSITPTIVSFNIAPFVNAMIRIGRPAEKELMFEAFINGDKIVKSTKRGANSDAVETIAEQSARNCRNAKSRQDRSKEKAMDLLDMKIIKNSLDLNKVIVTEVEEGEDVNPNLTGLVAMQLAAKYERPVIVARQDSNNCLKGSARTDPKSVVSNLKDVFSESGYFEFAEGRHSGL